MKTKTLALLTALAAISLPQAAFAFDPDKNADVLSRPRPEFDARGVRLGSFVLFPSISAGVAYHDNVFNVPAASAPQEDFLFTLTPELKVNSDWGRHALNFFAQSKSYFYQDFSDEDRTDWKVGGDVRVDVMGGTNVKFNALYEEVTEPRGTDPAVLADRFEQTEYSHWGVGGSLNHTGGRFRGSLGATYDEFDYDDVAKINGAPGQNESSQCPNGLNAPALPLFAIGERVICNNDDRDRTVFEAYAKAGYALSPGYAVFLRGKYNERDFTSSNPWNFGGGQPFGAAGLEVSDQNRNHDSQGWGVDLGVDFELTRLLVGEVFLGYTEQNYDRHPFLPAAAASFADTDAFTFGVDLQWYAQDMTTVTFNAKRSVEDTLDVLTGASGYISDRYGVRVDHELMRNVVLYGKVGFGQDEYQGTGVTREDDFLQAGLGAIFMVNNNLHVTASYDYIDRDSSLNVFDYDNNVFQLTVTGKL